MSTSGKCAVCGSQSTARCTNCRKIFYCSRPHQKEDWKRHKLEECFPGIDISINPVYGRYLISTQDFNQGSLIFKEKAIFSAPNGKNGSLLLCMGCYGVTIPDEDGESEICPKCKWPLHKGCLQDKVHRNNECEILRKNGISPSSKEENIYDKILILRGCLLKLQSPDKWLLISKLEGHREARRKGDRGTLMSRVMCDFILKKCGLQNSLTEEEVDHILGIVVVNAYVTEDNLTSSPDFHCGSFVFWVGSMPAHDCVPNCRWTITKDGGELKLYALRDIKIGESLTHCYAWGGTGTAERQKHLLKSKFFSCSCQRCKDPSELGSNYSTIKCQECQKYSVLNEDPTKLGSNWSCQNCHGFNLSEVQMESFLQELRNLHQNLPLPENDWILCLSRLEEHDAFLKTKVDPNHFLVQEVEQDILLRISSALSQEPLEEEEQIVLAQKMIQLSQKCISILDLIAPGSTVHRGRQLFYLQQGMGILILHEINMQTSDQGNKRNLEMKIKEWQETREKGALILSTESKGREEYVLGQAMRTIDQNTE